MAKYLLSLFVVSCSILNSKGLTNKNIDNKKSENNVCQQDTLIEWKTDVQLDWDDFRGASDTTSKYMAMTFTKIKSVPVYYDADSIIYNISNSFNCIDSWSRDKNSSSLLKHEKLHFDISELVTRKVRKEYNKIRIVEFEKTYSRLSELFRYYTVTVKDSINALYDEETNHGIIASKQKEWEHKIANELIALDAYSSTRVTIRKSK